MSEIDIVEQYSMIPECGPCEDGEHDDCYRPQGVSDAVGDLAFVCCCKDHPLVAELVAVRAERDAYKELLKEVYDKPTVALGYGARYESFEGEVYATYPEHRWRSETRAALAAGSAAAVSTEP